jgi:Methyltransferase domain/C-methyltransferase C-terminal domain
MGKACPICGSTALQSGLACRGVTAHSVVLHHSRESALAAARGEIALVGCKGCGFVFNAAYDPCLHHYAERYESTQAFSETFNAFNEELASEIADYARRDSGAVVEIGCGQGEFLYLLKKRGCKTLIGFDPAFDVARSPVTGCRGIEISARTFDSRSVAGEPNAVVCKMTLEHIADPVAMLRQMTELAGRSSRCEIFVQVPNASAIFSLNAFWDVYYEHCNYFTTHTLGHALWRAGLEPVSIAPVFANQYLIAHASVALGSRNPATTPEAASELASFERFCQLSGSQARSWHDRINKWDAAGERVLLWGGGSKAVAFLSFTGTEEHLLAAIDVNPRKSNSFLPGSCLPIISPSQAKELNPTVIILLNPIYRAEVERDCRRFGMEASIIDLGNVDQANAA